MYSFGWCSKIEDAESLHRLGFDYIECPLTALSLENGVECAEKIPLYLNSAIPVHAFNLFLPGDLKVVGPDVHHERVRRYLHAAAAVLHKIGAHTAVLGSGKARSVPEGWERSRADDQFVELLSRIADEFVGTGVTLAIEPLNTKESSIVNSVTEAVFFANLVNHSSIRVLADFYHMDEEKESLQTLVDNKEWLAHIHLADTGRLSPGTGSYPYEEFVGALRESGYRGMISAECKVSDPETEFAASLAFMKRAFQSPGS